MAGLVVLRRTRGRAEAFLAAFAFGLGLYGVALLWSLRFGIVAYLPLVAVQGLFVGVAGALSGGRGALTHAQWVAGITAAWTLAETARARWPLGGFEWAQLAQAVVDLRCATRPRWSGRWG